MRVPHPFRAFAERVGQTNLPLVVAFAFLLVIPEIRVPHPFAPLRKGWDKPISPVVAFLIAIPQGICPIPPQFAENYPQIAHNRKK
jgi:hypothetical protein